VPQDGGKSGREIPRDAWGDNLSMLASVHNAADIERARERGYPAAILVPAFPNGPKAFTLSRTSARIIPCPNQAAAGKQDPITCVQCRLCFDDERLLRENLAIAFAAHGQQKAKRARTRHARSVHIERDAELGNLVARAELDEERTTVTNEDLIECATANVFATEELLDKLKKQGDPTGGDIVLRISTEFPPQPKKPHDWPADGSSPDCPDGTVLAGELGKSQWCQRGDGDKHGDQFVWEDGVIVLIQNWENGSSTTARFRPRDL
jgi:hypothetical protein